MEMHLFRVITPDGDVTFIVATDEDQARNLYCDSDELEDGEVRLFRVEHFCDAVDDEQSLGLDELVDGEVAGIVVFEPRKGWHLTSTSGG